MKKYQVIYTDGCGTTSEIDVVEVNGEYTAEQYIADCKEYAYDEWNEMLADGEVEVFELEV